MRKIQDVEALWLSLAPIAGYLGALEMHVSTTKRAMEIHGAHRTGQEQAFLHGLDSLERYLESVRFELERMNKLVLEPETIGEEQEVEAP